MTPDDETIKAALEWMDRRHKGYAYSRGGEKHGQVLAAALREAQEQIARESDGVQVEAKLRIEQTRRAEAAEARIRELENGQDGNSPQRLVSVDYLRHIHKKSDRASALKHDLLASSLELRELREALSKCLDYSRAGFANGCDCMESPKTCRGKCHQSWITGILSRPSPNAERAERVLRVLANAEKWIGIRPGFAWSQIDTDYARELLDVAALDSRSEGA